METSPVCMVRVEHDRLRVFVEEVARRIGFPEAHVQLLAHWLPENDLRGVFTHGSNLLGRYMYEARRGGINVQPNVQVVQETPTSVLMDGDGGMGYFPLYEGTLRAIDKAKQHGMAAVVSRNHAHIGAAAIYARMTLEHDLATFVTSGVQLYMEPGSTIMAAGGGSPMCFSAPTLEEPPVVHDTGVMHDVHGGAEKRAQLMELSPGIVHRALGYAAFCQSWGGILAGLRANYKDVNRVYGDANQGAMLFTFKISLFMDPIQFKREMDNYVRQVRQLTPVVGDEAFLPGGIEARRTERFSEQGIPLADHHRTTLETLSNELGVPLPWDE